MAAENLIALCAGVERAGIDAYADYNLGAVELALTVHSVVARYVIDPDSALELAQRIVGAVIRLREQERLP